MRKKTKFSPSVLKDIQPAHAGVSKPSNVCCQQSIKLDDLQVLEHNTVHFEQLLLDFE